MGKNELLVDATLGGVSASLSLIHPLLGVASSTLAPIVKDAVISTTPEVMGNREKMRMDTVLSLSVEKIIDLISQGKVPRDDKAYYEDTSFGIPKAQEILEGVLLKAREEYQSKKLDCYSSFFANLCFDETISPEHADFLLNVLGRLSYRQLCILSYLSDNKSIPTNRWDPEFKGSKNNDLIRYFDFYSEYISLYNDRMIVQTTKIPGFALGMVDTNISSMGQSIVKLANLATIPKEDCESIGKVIIAINEIIRRN